MVFKIRTLSLPRTKEDLLVIHDNSLKRFSWPELKLATNNFVYDNFVGRGGFGSVYRGRLADGSLVAIKRCADITASQHELEFQTEVEIGGSEASIHRNVLRLLGYCMTPTERILVYPFLVNRSVDSWLRNRTPSEPPLDWPTRKRIALGAAKGIAHFHYGSSFTVIHRDVKPANILLNAEFEAVLCDFGLAKFVGRSRNDNNTSWVQRLMEGQHDEEDHSGEQDEDSSDHENSRFTKSCWNFTKILMLRPEDGVESRGRTKWSCWVFTKNAVVSGSGRSAFDDIGPAVLAYHDLCTHVTDTLVCGTPGYLDPEYYCTNRCTVKSDVYGYGVMLLELFTGQKAIIRNVPSDGDGNTHICCWAKQLFADDEWDLLADSNLGGNFIADEMNQLIQLAFSCTNQDPEKRPVMSEVIKIIENLGKRPVPDQPLGGENDLSLQRFSLPQLKQATDTFSDKNVIGKNGFNNVYRGRLQKDGSAVVVKRMVDTSKRGRMQFEAEVKLGEIISGKHPNLLELRGYCISGNERLLVYPFMPNRSLEWQLRAERNLALDWHVRMRIALGVAEGIYYLQYDCESDTSIRGDVELSNILLGEVFNPVLSNLRLQSNNSQGRDNKDSDDVYGYGIILFGLISGKVGTGDDNSRLHDRFKKLRHHEVELLVDPRLNAGDSMYDAMYMKDEIEQIIQMALLCTQPSPGDRPEMWEVMQMLQGINQGDLKICFAFDHANLFRFDEIEVGAMIDSPKLDPEASLSTDSSISYKSKAQHTKSRSEYKGITISDNASKAKMQEKWETLLSEIASDALPTKSKLFRSGTSENPLCPMCNEYEEDSFHLFFMCDFSRQAWQLSMGVRIDMLGFTSVKEAVDAILTPNGAGLNILPCDVEPSRFSHKGIALMHAIWIHRNQVCFDNVSPNVIQMLKDHPDGSDLVNCVQCESSQEIYPEKVVIPPNCVPCESSQEMETAIQPKDVLIPQGLANCVKCGSSQEMEVLPRAGGMILNQQNDFQLKITSGGILVSFKFTKLSVMCVVLLASLFMNVVLVWSSGKPPY